MQKCLVCSSKKLSTILDLGKTLANKFLTKDEINSKKEKILLFKNFVYVMIVFMLT